MPEVRASRKDWQTFHNTLQNILLTSREFKLDWKLKTKQYERLGAYLERTKFLLECLELAYVSNREAILEQLLLPPVPVEVEAEKPVQEQLLPVPIEQPVEEELSPVKVGWFGKWWVWLLIGGLAGWLINWLVG